MKKILLSALTGLLFAAALAACGGAHAAIPEAVVNTTGTTVFGTHTALVIKKDTSSGNRVAVRYSSGWQYVTDDAAWSKYTKLVTGMGARGLAVDSDSNGTVIAVADSNGIYCLSNQTSVSFPNVASPETLSDSCNFWVKVKANAN